MQNISMRWGGQGEGTMWGADGLVAEKGVEGVVAEIGPEQGSASPAACAVMGGFFAAIRAEPYICCVLCWCSTG